MAKKLIYPISEISKKKYAHKKIKNLDFKKIEDLIGGGYSSVEIAEKVYVSWPTVLKYTEIVLGPAFYSKLKQNGRKNKGHKYKDGRGIYRKFKQNSCQFCGSTKNLVVHHIEPGIYNDNYTVIIKGNHTPDNLLTLCNSCHQKEHYKNLGREHKVKHNKKTGRFIKNEE